VGYLDAVLTENEQALGAEDIDNGIDVRHRYSLRAQFGPAAPAALELAIQGNGGELGEHQARRVLLLTAKGAVSGLGTAIDRIGGSARAPVGAQSQPGALAAFPGSGHRLRHQWQHAAPHPAPGALAQFRDHGVDHGGFDDQVRLSRRPGHR
jgi:hypothetical protein